MTMGCSSMFQEQMRLPEPGDVVCSSEDAHGGCLLARLQVRSEAAASHVDA